MCDLDLDSSMAMLAYLACGQDEVVLREYYPAGANNLPDAPRLVVASGITKGMPTLLLGLNSMLESSTKAPHLVKTVYGRPVAWGANPKQALAHQIFGTVSDIIDVAMVSIHELGGIQVKVNNELPGWMRASISGYTEEDSMQWERKLSQIATLGEPLATAFMATPLSANVMVS